MFILTRKSDDSIIHINSFIQYISNGAKIGPVIDSTANPGNTNLYSIDQIPADIYPNISTYNGTSFGVKAGAGSDLNKILVFIQGEAKDFVKTEAEKERAKLFEQIDRGLVIETLLLWDEVLSANAAPDPLDSNDWPLIEAERQAQIQSGNNPSATLRQVIGALITQRTNWVTKLAQIRQVYRKALLEISNATTPAQIRAILDSISWPA